MMIGAGCRCQRREKAGLRLDNHGTVCVGLHVTLSRYSRLAGNTSDSIADAHSCGARVHWPRLKPVVCCPPVGWARRSQNVRSEVHQHGNAILRSVRDVVSPFHTESC